jgi:hypothetical protein
MVIQAVAACKSLIIKTKIIWLPKIMQEFIIAENFIESEQYRK